MKGKKTLKENDACKRVQRLEKAMQSYMAERERERGRRETVNMIHVKLSWRRGGKWRGDDVIEIDDRRFR